jgi:hypothetical protein
MEKRGDMSMSSKHFAVAILHAVVMLTLAFIPIVSQQAGTCDPWVDLNDDGKIDGKDIAQVAKGFGTLGTSITKAAISYDSGWINITDKQGQYSNSTKTTTVPAK